MLSKRSFLLLALLLTLVVSAQRTSDDRLRILMGIDVGMNMAKVAETTGEPFTTGPGLALTLDGGASFMHRKRWGLSALGTVALNGYPYRREGFNYNVYHQTFRAEAAAWWMFPFSPKHGTYLRVGSAFGASFIGGSGISKEVAGVTAVSSAEGDIRPFLGPEIALINVPGRHAMEFGLRYTRHLQRSPAMMTRITGGTSETLATSTNDSFGLLVRFHFGFKRPTPPAIPYPAIAFEERKTETLTTLSTTWDKVTLTLWDNAEYDGDTISVLLNGQPILTDHELSKSKMKLIIPLELGENYIVVVANNEGRVPPNTATGILQRGKGKEQLLIKTSKSSNMEVVIIRE